MHAPVAEQHQILDAVVVEILPFVHHQGAHYFGDVAEVQVERTRIEPEGGKIKGARRLLGQSAAAGDELPHAQTLANHEIGAPVPADVGGRHARDGQRAFDLIQQIAAGARLHAEIRQCAEIRSRAEAFGAAE